MDPNTETAQAIIGVMRQMREQGEDDTALKTYLDNLPEADYIALNEYQAAAGEVPPVDPLAEGPTQRNVVNPPAPEVPIAPAEEGVQASGIMSALGPTFRGVTEGALALPMMAAGGIFGDGIGDGARITDTIGDMVGARYAESPMERVYQDGVAGLTGGLMTGGVGAIGKGLVEKGATSLLPQVAAKLAGGRTGQAVSGTLAGLAGGTSREKGGDTKDQIISALVAGFSPQALQSALKHVTTKGVDPAAIQSTLRNFEEAGTIPSVGQATEGSKAQALEALLSNYYGSSGTMRNFARQQEESIGNTLTQKGKDFAGDTGTSNYELGKVLREQYDEVGKPRVSATREALAQDVGNAIDGAKTLPVEKYGNILDELVSVNPAIKSQLDTKLLNPSKQEFEATQKALFEDVVRGMEAKRSAGIAEADIVAGLPFEAVRELKTKIGQQIDRSVFTKNPADAELRRLYGGLSEDVKTFVESQGADAVEAFKKMNEWETAYAETAKLVRSVIDKNGGPEKVGKAIFAQIKDGPSVLKSVYSMLDEQGQKVMTGGVIQRLGEVTGKNAKDFDIGTFFSNYKKIDDFAKDEIFGKVGTGYRDSMEKIFDATKNISKEAQQFGVKTGAPGNLGIHSGIGMIMGLFGLVGYGTTENLLTTGAAALAGLGGAVAGSNAMAKYMTSPSVVKWMASNSKTSPSALPAAVNILVQEARKSQDEDLIAFSTDLQARLAAEKEGIE
jgi:hypothetical protein